MDSNRDTALDKESQQFLVIGEREIAAPFPSDCISEKPRPTKQCDLKNSLKYHTPNPTFEDYFSSPAVQRKYYVNILYVQLYTSFLSFLVAFICTITSNQQNYLDDLDANVGPLVVNSFVFIFSGSIFTLLRARYPFLSHPTWFLHITAIETLLRIYQAGLITFWTTLICEKVHRFQHEKPVIIDFDVETVEDQAQVTGQHGSPAYFCICLMYALNLSLCLGLVIWLRYNEKAKMESYTIHIFLLTTIGFVLLISIPSIFISRSSHSTWDLAQVLFASLFGMLDGLVIAYTLKIKTKHSSRGAGNNF